MIIQDGLRRMFTEQEDVFYYLTHHERELRAPRHAGRPARRGDRGDQAGHVPAASAVRGRAARPAPACSCWAAARSCARSRRPPSCWHRARRRRGHLELPQLHRAGPRHHRHGPVEPAAPRRANAAPAGSPRQLSGRPAGPVVAATDYMRAFAEQIRPSVPADRRYVVLGTDGFGRSDYRKALRRHFEVDRQHVVVAALAALAADGAVPASAVTDAHRPLRHRSGQARPRPRLRDLPSRAHHRRPSHIHRSERKPHVHGNRGAGSPTSATSATSRSSRCTWRPVTRSMPRTRC